MIFGGSIDRLAANRGNIRVYLSSRIYRIYAMYILKLSLSGGTGQREGLIVRGDRWPIC